VDNGSTDDTAKVAQTSWPQPAPAPLCIVSEPKLGQSNARLCGLESARYELVSFVDDDNRVASDWIERVSNRMGSDPAIGACGASIAADFEAPPPPSWWDEFQGCFAVGRQWPSEGDVTMTKGWLYGAGLTVRKSAWNQLCADGFRFYTSGRHGKALRAGDDNELCYALRRAGWKLWLDWNMQIRHFMPQRRLTWSYIRGLYRGGGATALTLRGYDAKPPIDIKDRLRMHWWWQVISIIRQLVMHPSDYWAYAFSRLEGDHAVLRTEGRLGQLMELLHLRGDYRKMLIEIRDARWRRQVPNTDKSNSVSASN
jgi:glycosyltransferase involved in cell wall biosynthesis